MSFLAPWFLAAAAAAVALPILFHLFRRTPQGRMPFSTLMFLSPSPPRLTRRSRLENWPLLLMRALVLVLLGLAFGRPLWRQLVEQSDVVPRGKRIVVLVDVSASMRRGDLWDRAVREAHRAVDAASPHDEVSLFSFAAQTKPLVTFDAWRTAPPNERAGLARAALLELTPGWSSTRFDTALLAAIETLDAADGDRKETDSQRAREIVLISDLQSGGRTSGLQSLEWPKDVSVEVVALAEKSNNAGVHLLEVREDSAEAAATITRPRVLVTNAAGSQQESFTLAWQTAATPNASAPSSAVPEPTATATDTASAAETVVPAYVPPGKTRVVRAPPLPPGDAAELVLSGDDAPFDNRLWFIPPLREQVRVLHLADERADDPDSLRYFLDRAFAAQPGGRIVTVETVDPHSAAVRTPTVDELDDVGLVVVSGDQPLPQAWNDVLATKLDRGLSVAAVVAKSNDGPWRGLLPAQLAEPGRIAVADPKPSQEYALLGTLDLRHPLLAPFNDPRYSDFTKIRFWRHRRLTLDDAAAKAAHIVARFDSGDPAIVEVPRGMGRLVMFAAGWQPRESQLGVSSKFVPLVTTMVELGRRTPPPAFAYETGATIDLRELAGAMKSPGDPTPSPLVGEGGRRPDEGANPSSQPAATVSSTVAPTSTTSPTAPVPQEARRDAGPWTVKTPSGHEQKISADAPQWELADGPGVYEVRSAAGLQRIAANIPVDESKTAPLGTEALETLGVRLAMPTAEASPATIEEKRSLQLLQLEDRQQLWRLCLAAAIGLTIVETWYAGRVARREAVA